MQSLIVRAPLRTITIARSWGGPRATVPIYLLRGPHIAIDQGGNHRRLPHPMLGLYLTDCRCLPAGFGHDCNHGQPPHVIKVLVPRSGNSRELYDELWAVAARMHKYGYFPRGGRQPRRRSKSSRSLSTYTNTMNAIPPTQIQNAVPNPSHAHTMNVESSMPPATYPGSSSSPMARA